MTNLKESVGKDVRLQSADELFEIQRHLGFGPRLFGAIEILEGDLLFDGVKIQQPLVGDSESVRVA